MNDYQEFSPEQVRDATGVSRSQLRYWERQGIIVPTLNKRTQRTIRRYAQDQVQRVQFIRHLLTEGWTLRAAAQKLATAGQQPVAGADTAPLAPAQA